VFYFYNNNERSKPAWSITLPDHQEDEAKSSRVRIFFLIFSIACHGVAVVQFLLNYQLLKVGSKFHDQFFILIVISLLITFVISIEKSRHVMFFIAFHAVIIAIAGYPLEDYLGVEFTLITIFIIETVLTTDFPYNLVISLLFIAIDVTLQKPITAWGKVLPSPTMAGLLSFAFYSLIILLLSFLMKNLYVFLIQEKSQVKRLDEAVKQLMNANIGFQEYAKEKEKTSKISERKRVASEIHDTIGYTLTNIMMMMEAMLSLIRNEPCKINNIEGLIVDAKKQTQEGLKEIRKVLYLLRNERERELKGMHAIKKIVKTFQQATNVEIDIDLGNLPWILGEPYDSIVYRLVQEGMTNAFRHGKATKIWLYFFRDDSGIYVHIRDNGIGSSKIKKGMGLLGMTERIASIGGKISAYNIQTGFELDVWFPYRNSETESKILTEVEENGKNQGIAGR